MRHNYKIKAFGFSLRPVDDIDAAWIVALRNSAKARFLHQGAQTEDQQLAWLQEYYKRDGDYTFIIERGGNPEGMIALYNHNLACNSASWGRWILVDGSLAAIASVWLILHFGFDLLGCDEICSQTVAENQSVVSFHDRYARRRGILTDYFIINRKHCHAVEHVVAKSDWPNISTLLSRLAVSIEAKLKQ